MKITILGAGRWASCIGLCFDRKKYDVLMWDLDLGRVNPLFLTHTNNYVTLSDRVHFTHDLEKAVNHSDIIVISILSQKVDEFMQKVKQIKGYDKKTYVLCMKGIEATTGRRLSEILIDNGVDKNNIAVFVGPGHVQSISAGQSTHMTISAYDSELAKKLQKVFQNEHGMNVSITKDIIGTEIGAAAKNVYGIASGILSGSHLEQEKGPLLSASTHEIGNFIRAMGGDYKTASGLAFAGEVETTFFSPFSKNLTYGKTIAERKTTENLSDVLDINSVEGIMTSHALIKKMEEFNKKVDSSNEIKMPIAKAVSDICSGKVPLENVGKYISEKITESLNID